MSNKKQLKLLRRLLLGKRTDKNLWLSLIVVCLATTLLLFSVMIYWGYKEVLTDKYGDDNLGTTFITLSKEVVAVNKNQPRAATFTYTEIDAINGLPQVQDVGVLTSNKFPVKISLNSPSYGFSKAGFLESIPDNFIDDKPVDWVWQYRNINVPVIVPSSFLEIYNYGLALSEGLPQLSKPTAMSLAFDLEIGDSLRTEIFTMNIVGFSDRINSILVPQTFLDYGNDAFAPDVVTRPSRLVINVSDPSDEQFVSFLKNRDYSMNSELLRWNKLRGVIEVVGYTTGVVVLLLFVLVLLVYLIFVSMKMNSISSSVNQLIILGYSPRFLKFFVFKGIIILLLPVFAAVALLSMLAQQHIVTWLKGFGLIIPIMPGWPVWLALILSFTFLVFLLVKATFNVVK